MTENTGNVQENGQNNSENSINDQDNSGLNTEINDAPIETPEGDDDNSDTPAAKAQSDDDELELPEPDISDEEIKKKKEMPEWMKKKLEREKAASEREKNEAAALKAENERLRALAQQPNQQPQVQPQGNYDPNLPRRDQFASDEDYFFALSDYRDMSRAQAIQFHQRQQAVQKAERDFQDRLKGAIDDGAEKYKDFNERTDYILYGDGFPSNRAMAEAIVESEYKSDILYFLGTHVKEAEKIASMNPVQAVKEIAKLESRFIAKKRSNITKAPKLIQPLGSNKGSATNGDPGKMGMDEFTSWYQGQFG